MGGYPPELYRKQKKGSNMLKGEAKKNYQREYMRDYMRKRRGLNKQVLTTDVGLNKGLTGAITVKQALDIKQELTPTKTVLIGGQRFNIPC